MKAFFLIILLFLVSVSAFAGRVETRGTFVSDSAFNIHGKEGGTLAVKPGQHNISFVHDDRWRTKNDIFKIRFNNSEWSLRMPDSAFKAWVEGKAFSATEAELGQSFGMRGSSSSKVIEVSQKKEKSACQYCGYCFGLTIEGKFEYGYNTTCDGTQEILNEYKLTHQTKTIEMTLNQRVVGRFTSALIPRTSVHKMRDLTDCK